METLPSNIPTQGNVQLRGYLFKVLWHLCDILPIYDLDDQVILYPSLKNDQDGVANFADGDEEGLGLTEPLCSIPAT